VPLDPHFRKILDQLSGTGALPLTRDSVKESRKNYRSLALARRGPGYRPQPVESVRDEHIDGPGGPLSVRVYRAGQDHGPAITYLHGGGWVLGDLDTHDPICRRLASALGAVVVSVAYRLAPEHHHPAAVEDAVAALHWTAQRFPDRPLGVAGDSAGASVAAASALRARDDHLRLAGQLLLYPPTDPSMSQPSMTQNAEGYFLTRADMRWFFGHYTPSGAGDPTADLLAADVARVTPAVVATAEFDPLRDEGALFAGRLRAAGVPVVHVPGPGMIHGYFGFLGVVEAADALSLKVLAAFGSLLSS
jgi:acetyl esterase